MEIGTIRYGDQTISANDLVHFGMQFCQTFRVVQQVCHFPGQHICCWFLWELFKILFLTLWTKNFYFLYLSSNPKVKTHVAQLAKAKFIYFLQISYTGKLGYKYNPQLVSGQRLAADSGYF
jgi:hypothetical protein